MSLPGIRQLFKKSTQPIQSYTVYFYDDDNVRQNNWWTIVLTKANGTTVTVTSPGVYTECVSISITGRKAYVELSEGSSAWYSVYTKNYPYRVIFNGSGQPSCTSFNAPITEDISINYYFYEASGCFSSNMTVKMSDGTDKLIGDVISGDYIKAWNCIKDSDQEELTDALVKYSSIGFKRISPKYEQYTFDDGTIIEIINRDRLYNVEDNKMKWMDQWKIGEHGLTYDGREVSLVEHKTIEEPIVFHDITCEYYNYYINGMLAGQKNARYPFFPSKFHHNN